MDTLLRELTLALGGRYRLDRELGHGGMATVFLGQDTKHDRQVALKVLRPEVAATLGAERFLREIQIAARLSHPHILPLHDSGQAGPFVYYVMPYVPGESLRDRIRREQQLPVEDAVRIAREVAGALGFAHSHDVIHRDIKPENILFQGGLAVVVDFGIGRAISLAEHEHLTQPGLSIGTPGYMSPEQAGSDPAIDGRSDLYSLGCVLYEMLVGERPAPPSLRGRGSEPDQLVAPRLRRDSIPPHVEAALLRLLARVPADRFATAHQFIAELDDPRTQTRVASGSPGGPPSIAVLPFANLSPDPEAEYFSDGITEEIINALTRVGSLRVASRTSAFAFKATTQDVRTIGTRLNASAILEGSVRKAGNRLRITAHLVNTADGFQMWGERFDREMADIFAVQDEISRAIVSTLKVKLQPRNSAPLVRPSTEDMEAYSLYLKGRYYWNKRYEVGLNRGLEFFQGAIASDPGYALAHAGVADSFSVLGFYGFLPPRLAFERARAAADRVMALDPELGEAWFSRGMIRFWYDWDWAGAESDFQRSLELKPSQAEAHIFLSQLYTMQGRFAEAIAQAERAQQLDPVSPLINAMAAYPHYSAGDQAGALAQCTKALEIDPGFSVALWIRSLIAMAQGRLDEAIASAQRGIDLAQRSTFLLGTLGCALALARRPDDARVILRELEDRARTGYVAPFHNAVIHASLGDTAAALACLTRALEDRNPNMVTLGTLPVLEPLRSEPEFQRLWNQVKGKSA